MANSLELDLSLAEHLGGAYEPLGQDFPGANFCVPAGLEGVPGLVEGYDQRPA